MESALTGEPVIALCGKVWTRGGAIPRSSRSARSARRFTKASAPPAMTVEKTAARATPSSGWEENSGPF